MTDRADSKKLANLPSAIPDSRVSTSQLKVLPLRGVKTLLIT